MSLSPGTRLGPYEIVSPIGAGGMGEVYRGRDTKLNRDVAIKVLPEAFAADADRLTRFNREAQTLAQLNHPNIAAIYGIEESSVQGSGSSVQALVMELVEGEDLSALIAASGAPGLQPRGIPLTDALPIAKQIAEALEAAHELNIVHRDLKPANIKVRADGTVKVLDFGLAKAVDPAGASSSGAANSPTLTAHATQMGMIIGTAAYMSPEQAKGKSVDRRADIWAFGVVLYEMLTGQQAFSGDSITEILGAVVLKEPDWSKLPVTTPPRLQELLQRCIQKDVRTRQRGMGDVTLELGAIAAAGSGVTAAIAPEAPRRRFRAAIAAGALVIAAIGIAIGWLLPHRSAAASFSARFIVGGSAEGRTAAPAISPDGRVLVFQSNGRLYKRDLLSFETMPIAGTEGAASPMVSPEGNWVGFFANGKLKKVSLAGGDPTTIAEANSSMPGAVWGPDDAIFFSRGWATGLSTVSASSGESRQLTDPDRANGERGHWRPHLLPDGQRVLFTIMMAGSGVNDARIALLNLKTGQHRVLFPGTDGMYLPSGHVLYFHAGAWHVVPFDVEAEKTTGDAVTVLDDAIGIAPDGGDSGNTVAVAENGTLVYPPGPYYKKRELVWMDKTGQIESLGLSPHRFEGASLSPDGRQIAVTRVENGTFEIWMNDVDRKTEDRLDIKGSNFDPLWNPRGSFIAFTSVRTGQYDIYKARTDGSNEEPMLTKDFDESAVAWLHDGRRLVVKEWRPDGSTPVTLLDPSAGNSQQMLLPQGASLPFGVSPGDRWLLYSTTTSGTSQVYVKALATNGTAIRVSSHSGGDPQWSPDGHEIYFRHGEDLAAVSFREEGDRVVIGPERVMFHLPLSSSFYGVSPDGRRFLVGRLAEPEPAPGIRVVLNWFDELKGIGRTK